MTVAQALLNRGWQVWSRTFLFDGKTLYLCPEVEFDRVPNGTAMCSISGERVVKGRDPIDNDTRGGYLAFGVLVTPHQEVQESAGPFGAA